MKTQTGWAVRFLAGIPAGRFLAPLMIVLLMAAFLVAVPEGVRLFDELPPKVQLLALAFAGATIISGTLLAISKLRLGGLVARAHKRTVTIWMGAGSFAEVIIGQTRSTIRDRKLLRLLSESVSGVVGWTVGESELAADRVQERYFGFPAIAVLIKAGRRSMLGAIRAGKGELRLWQDTTRGFLRGKQVPLQMYFVGFGLTSLSRSFVWKFAKERVGEVVCWWFMRTPGAQSLVSLEKLDIEESPLSEDFDTREQALMKTLEMAEPDAGVDFHNGHSQSDTGVASRQQETDEDDLLISVDATLLEAQAAEEEIAPIPDGEASLGMQKDPVLANLLEQAWQRKQTIILGDSSDNSLWRTQAEVLSLASHQTIPTWDGLTDSRTADAVERVDIRVLKKVCNVWVASEVRVLNGAVGVNTVVEDLQQGELRWSLTSFNPKLPWRKRRIVICTAVGESEAIAAAGSELRGGLPGCTVKLIAHAVKGAKETYMFFLAPITKSELLKSCYGTAAGGLIPSTQAKAAQGITTKVAA